MVVIAATENKLGQVSVPRRELAVKKLTVLALGKVWKHLELKQTEFKLL